ncbi:MAG: hypothetical protein ACFFA8_15620 [Promethearchaeota archaeon]
MFNIILLIGSFVLFLTSAYLLLLDLGSKNREENIEIKRNLPKLGSYSFLLNLIALLLLVFVSFGYDL